MLISPQRDDGAQIRPFCCCDFVTPLSHEIADSPTQCPTPNTFNYHFAQTSQAKLWFLAATSATRQPKMTQEAPRWRLGAPRWPQKGPVQSATNTVLQTKSKRNQDGPPQCPPRLPQSVCLVIKRRFGAPGRPEPDLAISYIIFN